MTETVGKMNGPWTEKKSIEILEKLPDEELESIATGKQPTGLDWQELAKQVSEARHR